MLRSVGVLCLTLGFILSDCGVDIMSFSAAFRRCRKMMEGAGIEVTAEPIVDTDPKNSAYEACSLDLAHKHCAYRSAKITPTKNGAFVTCWKRPGGKGPIVPYTSEDLDVLLVSVEEGGKFGFFAFPAQDLQKQDILQSSGKKGKLSFRVYAPWVVTESKQAAATQAWQKPFFVQSGSTSWLLNMFGKSESTQPSKRPRLQ